MNNEIKDETTQTENTQSVEENIDQTAPVEEVEAKKDTESEFISEFAPEPIKIPKYNKEKEMAKVKKAKEKKKKRNSKKSRRRRKLLRKIVLVARNVVLFAVLFAVLTATLSVLLVKMNTSEYSVEAAIRTSEPESFVVGRIKNPARLNIKESSPRASVADVVRDNSMIAVTYADIEQAILKSSYPDFVSKVAHNIIGHYVYGAPAKAITAKDISSVMLENVSYIKLVTGTELGESACDAFGEYIIKSKVFKEITPDALQRQKAATLTPITSVAFSMAALICLVVAFMLLLVITILCCNRFAHKMVGWATILSGITVGVLGFLFKPMFSASSEFVTCILDALTSSFNQSALIFGAIVMAVGLIVILIGRAMSDEDDDEEEEYIDEIEQVSTAQ